jgi:hypothetical protein
MEYPDQFKTPVPGPSADGPGTGSGGRPRRYG